MALLPLLTDTAVIPNPRNTRALASRGEAPFVFLPMTVRTREPENATEGGPFQAASHLIEVTTKFVLG